MPKLNRKMPSWEGVAAGQTATVRLPVGNRFHNIVWNYSGVTLAQMDEIRVIANGKTIQRLIGADVLDSMNQFDGRNAASGTITLDFERYGLTTRMAREITLIDTSRKPDERKDEEITTLTIEVDINASATAPVFTAPKAKQTAAAGNDTPLLKHVRVFGYDPAGSGEFEIADLPKMGAINRIFFKSAATINSMKLQRDGYDVFERSQAENEVAQADGVRVPQAGYYVIDFSEEGDGQDWLEVRGAQDVRFKLDMAGAGHVDAIVEYIDTLKG